MLDLSDVRSTKIDHTTMPSAPGKAFLSKVHDLPLLEAGMHTFAILTKYASLRVLRRHMVKTERRYNSCRSFVACWIRYSYSKMAVEKATMALW